ncbi:hypothetical protein P154DRAFT_619221 [Amniculicola lignicola CBS 123094]|uniref:Uncharacterized protein n=1 Tax=Amniculicola lignicola CBS 123094 TaxID=1392246 RepID=A0A6A5WJB9_9PLEO|nr:hypothetical protein P154DRAFT_619221 [Amniculicola lignicola CBS 123094]
MTPIQVSWQSAFWSLPPLAINTMMQPSGRVCAFHPSLRTYLRSSPIVCAVDAVFILVRFSIYMLLDKLHSPALAAKRVLAVRNQPSGESKGVEGMKGRRDRGLQELEQKSFFRILWFVAGVLTQTVKLMACKGLPWTLTWGCSYLGSFLVVEVMRALDRSSDEKAVKIPEESQLEYWLGHIERALGGAAVLLQLAVLATVDLAGIPPDRNISKRWKFRTLRLFAHFVPVFIYLPFILSHSDDPARSNTRRMKSLVLSMLLVNIVLITLHSLNYRFSHMYVLWSLGISMASWLLFFNSETRKHVLMCEEENMRIGSKNVFVFDFFSRILCFSLFWYVWYYDSSGTSRPDWTNNLG